jgi:hypothetical protein
MKSKIDLIGTRRRHARVARAMLCIAGTALFAGLASAGTQTIAGTVDTSAAFSATNQSGDGTTYFDAPYTGALPAAPVTVGDFDFSVPSGFAVSGATISGNFGSDALGSGSAEVDLFVNSVQVATCDSACAAATQSADVAWSFTFTAAELGALADGSAVLSAVQQGVSQIVLDPTSVSLTVSAVPEPAGLSLTLLGLPLIVRGLRRRARSRQA